MPGTCSYVRLVRERHSVEMALRGSPFSILCQPLPSDG